MKSGDEFYGTAFKTVILQRKTYLKFFLRFETRRLKLGGPVESSTRGAGGSPLWGRPLNNRYNHTDTMFTFWNESHEKNIPAIDIIHYKTDQILTK